MFTSRSEPIDRYWMAIDTYCLQSIRHRKLLQYMQANYVMNPQDTHLLSYHPNCGPNNAEYIFVSTNIATEIAKTNMFVILNILVIGISMWCCGCWDLRAACTLILSNTQPCRFKAEHWSQLAVAWYGCREDMGSG